MKNSICFELKEILSLEEIKNLDKKYEEFIRSLECIACFSGNVPEYRSETTIHHESISSCFGRYKRFTNFHGLPLCDFHHHERHKFGINVYEKWFGNKHSYIIWSKYLIKTFFANEGIEIENLTNISDSNKETFDYMLYDFLKKSLLT